MWPRVNDQCVVSRVKRYQRRVCGRHGLRSRVEQCEGSLPLLHLPTSCSAPKLSSHHISVWGGTSDWIWIISECIVPRVYSLSEMNLCLNRLW